MTALLQRLREDTIGADRVLDGPYGPVPLVYADYTASGRAVGRVERWIERHVLPTYANTHSESAHCGARTTRLLAAARQSLREALCCRSADQLVFCGAGATAAIHKWIDLLELREPRQPAAPRPVVVIGAYEHHSNDLPWRELDCDLQVVPLAADGGLDVDALARLLARLPPHGRLVASFSAASNVTGVRTDIDRINRLVHAHDGVCGWDFAAAAPYVAIDMQSAGGLDAVFVSPHKFLGGPGSPGMLVFDARTVTRQTPTRAGGGTVSFVSRQRHRYVGDPTRREEAGTPDIIGAIRAALAFRLRDEVGLERIEAIESRYTRQAIARLQAQPSIELLGSAEAPRLPILSFRVHHEAGELHFGLVVALLDDLFGIQARGGCSCAGRYGHELLGIDEDSSVEIERRSLEEGLVHRPGWTRLGLHYAMDEATVDYVLEAIELIAMHGWKLQSDYRLDPATGSWRHRGAQAAGPEHLPAWDRDAPDPRAGLEPVRREDVLVRARRLLAGDGAARSACDQAGSGVPATRAMSRSIVRPAM